MRARPTSLIAISELERFARGTHGSLQEVLGAHPLQHEGRLGMRFACWAPAACAVEVLGDFSDRQPQALQPQGHGVWAGFVADVAAGSRYHYRLKRHPDEAWLERSDPYARSYELRPAKASVVTQAGTHLWHDVQWMSRRRGRDWRREPVSIYEIHLGSWKHPWHRPFHNYRELAPMLADYLCDLGYTHVELMPITEHPHDASWGYQTTGYFAPTSRYGTPDDFRFFVDHLHQRGIGVLLDWSAAHFPRDEFALAQFDGGPLYEHADPERGEHPDWDSLIFDYGQPQVRDFLISSALFWLEEFHLDGLRVDACASMLYLDYSREAGEWTPNKHGGKENLEAVHFLQQLNDAVHARVPGALMIAEESTAWPGITRPTWLGGLGFDLKWNMGWMHDSLNYLSHNPIYRPFHHEQITFAGFYAHHEQFLLPLSHDEVVHGKSPLLFKMFGADAERYAALRLLCAYQWTWPGKKLLFMGNEFAPTQEWNHHEQLDWSLLHHAPHAGLAALVRDLNRLYRRESALHAQELEARGFEWVDYHDAAQSVISYLRVGPQDALLVVLNFSPTLHREYRVGAPRGGDYLELLNTDSAHYGGHNHGNGGRVTAEPLPCMGRRHSLTLTLPPLSALIFRPDSGTNKH